MQPLYGAIPFIGAFESTYQPAHDRDIMETTQHDTRWRDDLALLASCGVRRLRYPVRWHRVEPDPGCYDWAHTDRLLGFLHDEGFEPIVDLLHHTSYPRWLGDFSSPRFGDAFLRFVEAVAGRYPWLPAYTVCNEPFTTFLLCGQVGAWPPHHRGIDGLVGLASNVFPAVTAASRALRDLLPRAEHVHVEVAERHTWSTAAGEEYAAMANERRFFFTDLLVGRPVDPDGPFACQVAGTPGGETLFGVEAGHVSVLGLDYYAHNQWHWWGDEQGTNVAPAPSPLADVIDEYARRYDLPVLLGETNIRGFASDRASWLKYTLEQCEVARDRGADVRGYCWFPFVDSADWASLLHECVGAIDPVGVFWLDDDMERHPSSMSVAYALAARGTPARDLPAYRFREPVATWLAGWLPQLSHWQWRPPPRAERCSNNPAPDGRIELRTPDVA